MAEPARPRPFSQTALNGAVTLLAALQAVPEDERLDALVATCNVAIATNWLTTEPRLSSRRSR